MRALALFVLLWGGAAILWGAEHFDTNTRLATADPQIIWKRNPVEGYTLKPSYSPGETVQFMISTTAGYNSGTKDTPLVNCSMVFYRAISHNRLASGSCSDELKSDPVPPFQACFHPLRSATGAPIWPGSSSLNPVDFKNGCSWGASPTVSFQIPTTGWPSGFYYAKVTDSQGQVGYIPFVVKKLTTASAAPILCVIAWNTYQAYNFWGGGSYYPEMGFASYNRTNFKQVSFRRPFTTFTWDNTPVTNQLGEFKYRERQFVAWVQETSPSYQVDYCVDADVDADMSSVLAYKCIVIAGHSEYWTYNQRTELQNSPLASGVNLPALASNNCYWRVDYSQVGNPAFMTCDKSTLGPLFRNQTDGSGQTLDEARFLGVDFMGVNYPGPNSVDTVRMESHWIFRGTNLHNNSPFGLGGTSGGDVFDPIAAGEADMTKLNSHSGTQILASAGIRTLTGDDIHYHELAPDSSQIEKLYAHMTYYEDQVTNARVFAAGGMGWCTSLYGTDSQDATNMGLMQQQILDHFSGRKYIGPVYRAALSPLVWSTPIELDGDVDVPAGKGLKLNGTSITVDGNTTFSDNGVIEVSANSIITGGGTSWGTFVVRAGGVLHVDAGVMLTLQAPLYFVLQNGSSLVLDEGATLNIKTNMTCGSTVDITVPARATVNVQPPAAVYLSPNRVFKTYGALNVIGSAGQPVLFDRLGSGAPWMGLSYQAGSSGAISYATIQNAQKGVECLGVMPAVSYSTIQYTWSGLWASGVAAGSAGEVHDNLIQTSGNGIYLYGSAPRAIYHNTITGNENGIYCYAGSSPYLSYNTIRNNSTNGLLCQVNSPARLGVYPYNDPGHNVITANATGIACDGSNALLGQGTYYAYNSIYSNTGYELTASNSSQVWAQYNYWGHASYPYYVTGDYSIANGSSVNYSPALGTNPNQGMLHLAVERDTASGVRMLGNAPSPDLAEAAGDTSFFDSGLLTALQALEQGRLDEAITLYRERFKTESDPAKRCYVLEQIGYCYRTAGRTDFQTFLTSEVRPTVATGDRLYALSLELGGLDLVSRQEYRAALEPFKGLVANFGTTERFVKHALFNLGFLSLVHLGDVPAAAMYFSQLQHSYPQDGLNRTATDLLRSAQAATGQSLAKGQAAKTAQVEAARYLLAESYPNPFNPSTMIRFALTTDAQVRLAVYDILGREVARLADGIHQAGYHTIPWNAQNAASGLYFARLTVTNELGKVVYSKTNKLLLTK